jgi:flagellin-specific chaperone FliS
MHNNRLLFFVDEGGFEDYTDLFTELGFSVDFEDSQRKATKLAKKQVYQVLVAEFSYNPEFRDRVSNIESLLATLESASPEAKIIVLYDNINLSQFEQLKARYHIDCSLAFPINRMDLIEALSHLN